MRPVTVTVGPLASASATNIRTSSSATLGAMVLNGTLVSTTGTPLFLALADGQRIAVPVGAALLDSPRQVLFTTAASEAGHTVAVSGLDRQGNLQSETVTLPSSGTTVATVLSYAVLLTATISANSNNSISIGTNGVAESAWVRLDEWALPGVGLQVDAKGTVNYTVMQSLDDPNSPTNSVAPSAMTWINSADAAVVAATASQQSNYNFAPIFTKVVLNSGTGSVSATFSQYGVVSR